MARPVDRESNIERAAFRQTFPGMPEKLAKRKPVVRRDDPIASSEFRNLPPLIPFITTVRLVPGGKLQATFNYEDIGVPIEERKPNELYLLEKVRTFHDLDTAARGFGYVSRKYAKRTGEYTAHVRHVMEAMQEISYELQKTGVTDEDLAIMTKQAGQVFVESRFANSHSPEVIEIMKQTLSALSRDAKKRINTPGSRLKLAQARPRVTRLQFKGRTIHNKNEGRMIGVLQEREFELMNFRIVEEQIEAAMRLSVGDKAFEKHEPRLRELIYAYLSPDAVPARPFAPIAAEARFLVFANDRITQGPDGKTAEERLAQYVGETQASVLAKTKTYKELDVWEKRERLKDIAEKLKITRKKSYRRLNSSWEELLFEPSLFDDGLLKDEPLEEGRQTTLRNPTVKE